MANKKPTTNATEPTEQAPKPKRKRKRPYYTSYVYIRTLTEEPVLAVEIRDVLNNPEKIYHMPEEWVHKCTTQCMKQAGEEFNRIVARRPDIVVAD